ncbi:hypothetical protein ACP2W0_01265 [Pseudobacillus badius]|uniref:hypothetical protein n=1 Tax=Bacillus badius TaxID=1455 RepID=UPI000A489500|nr:hypothetical protein [Bacillus badius]MED0666849.1 hypothetical protein [Bacillus badius]TDW02545.1 hypothetical protein B0G66_106109 [Bacillus badius]UAT30662.1 hypothetical protein K7T73_19420 [Bacillus badius]GLY08885.1 hypothetical protein Bbad01_01010 [Bacillus badius]
MKKQLNPNVAIEKVNDHFCVIREDKASQKNVELCFYSLADALSYASERNYG